MFGEMYLSLDRRLTSVDDLASPTEILKLLKISASDFGTMSMRSRFHKCAYEFLTIVTKCVVHGV